MRHIYEFRGYPISEEMLLGLGEGVGFIYWHMKGSTPFLGGRANVGALGEGGEGYRRTGVEVQLFRTNSAAKGEKTLLKLLAANEPVMLLLDMGYLPYFDFGGEEFHFGYHAIVACGYDAQNGQVLIADRDEVMHPVSLADLAKARLPPTPPSTPGSRLISAANTYLSLAKCAGRSIR
jgi:hypothetical protein